MTGRFSEVLARLRQEPGLSRNRHYDFFQSPEARQALRAHLRVKKLQGELLGYAREGSVRVIATAGSSGSSSSSEEAAGSCGQGAIILEVDLPSLRLRRHIHLHPLEMEALCEDPRLADLLGQIEARLEEPSEDKVKAGGAES
jgi:hypothetical protein